MDYIMGIASCVIIIWLGSILSILAHEAGHMLGYLLSAGKEIDDWYVTVGRCKEIFKTKRLLICLFPISGHFECGGNLSNKSALLTLAGGPISSFLITVALFVLLASSSIAASNTYIRFALCFVAYYNLGLFVYTIISLRYPAWLSKIPQSDGLAILRLLKRIRK